MRPGQCSTFLGEIRTRDLRAFAGAGGASLCRLVKHATGFWPSFRYTRPQTRASRETASPSLQPFMSTYHKGRSGEVVWVSAGMYAPQSREARVTVVRTKRRFLHTSRPSQPFSLPYSRHSYISIEPIWPRVTRGASACLCRVLLMTCVRACWVPCFVFLVR